MSWTYDTLKTAIEGTVTDSSTAFDASLDTLIQLAEEMCVSDLELDIWKNVGEVTLSSGAGTAPLPLLVLRLYWIYYVSNNTRVFLLPRSLDYCIDYWTSTTGTGTPLYWANYPHSAATQQRIYVAPTPSTSLSCVALGLKRPTSLVVDTNGTWLSYNAAHLLYLATLVKSEQFNESDERIAMWKTEYAEELARKRLEFASLITPDFALGQMPAGA